MTPRSLFALSFALAACASPPTAPFTTTDTLASDAFDATEAAPTPPDAAPGDLNVIDAMSRSDVAPDVARDAVGAVDVPAPDVPMTLRPLAPESTGFVASRRPTLRWSLGAGFDGAEAELCSDRACHHVLATLRGASAAQPTEDLPPGPVFWRLRGTRGAVLDPETSATWEFVVGARSASAGTGWSGLFDANGDGLGDVAVGVPHAMYGLVRVFHGSASGPVPGAMLLGDSTSAMYGQAVANAGDLNGDGYADLAVGSSGARMPGTDTPGEVRVYLGGPTGISETSVRVLHGEADETYLGWAIAGAGDLDGDGYADLALSALRIDAIAQVQVRIFRGRPDGVEATPSRVLSCGEFIGTEGLSVAGIGDVNGDGAPDLAVGVGHISDTEPGVVTVFLAGSWAATELRGGSNESFGQLVRGAGDVNGDGYSDLAVASPLLAGPTGAARVGAVWVYAGSPSGVLTTPFRRLDDRASVTGFGTGLAGAGDANADGFWELLASADGADHALTFYGAEHAADNGATLSGAAGAIGAVAGLGDLNGDGRADVATVSEQPDGRGTVTVYTNVGASKPAPSTVVVGLGLGLSLAGLR